MDPELSEMQLPDKTLKVFVEKSEVQECMLSRVAFQVVEGIFVILQTLNDLIDYP